jgi:RimJ/RimL family protein N-acetyltransferase
MNDPEITATLEFNLGISRKQEEAFFDRIEGSNESEFVWAILDETERHIGFIALTAINWRNRAATGGLVIGDRTAWGCGYATDAVRGRTRFAFAQLGLHRINGHTFNPAMKRVYEKCGYRHEGTARQMFFRDGTWHDVALYGILESDWLQTVQSS